MAPSGLSRSIEPLEPIVTKRRASLISRASIMIVMMPISMIEPASTAATPVWRDEMLR